MSVSITNGVNYSLKPTSVKANRKQVVIPSSNKTDFSPEETCIFYLPSLRNNVMDGQSGYLRFTLQVATAACNLDVSAHSLIERIQTYGSGGQLISDLQNYSVLATMLLDLQLSQSEKIGLSSMLGCEDTHSSVSTTLTNTSGNNVGIGGFPLVAVNDGTAFGTNTGMVATNSVSDLNRSGRTLAIGTYTFCIPLLHPLFTLSEKMWPCFAMNDDTRLEIQWSSVSKAVYSAGAPVLTIKNPEIIVDFIEFDSAVFPLIQQTYAGRDLIVPAQDYRYYASQIASGTSGNISQIIPSKVMSARAFFFAFRPAQTQIQGAYSVGSRVNPFWALGDNLALNIGGVKVPQRPITTRVSDEFSEWFASTQQSLHAMNNLSMNGGITLSYYERATKDTGYVVGASSYRNAFALGINTDTLQRQSDSSNSGLNLSNITTYYEGYIGTAPTQGNAATQQSVSVDTYVLHDTLYIVDASGSTSLRF